MTDDAEEYLKRIAGAYAKAGFQQHTTWQFDRGKDTAVHTELRSRGLIKWLGTRGAPYVLTDQGHARVLEIIDAGEAVEPPKE